MLTSTIAIFVVLCLIFFAFVLKDVLLAKRRHKKYRLSTCASALLMGSPAIVLGFLFVLLPIVYSLAYAFTDFYLLRPNNIKFNNFENFKLMFEEIGQKGDLFNAIKNTFTFVIGVVPLQIGLALALAIFVNRQKRGVGIFKVCYFAPVVISLTVTSYLWLEILSPAETGILNMILGWFGAAPKDFLRDPDGAMWWIVLLSAWQGCGYQMLIFLSGLTNVRKELYEAAALDGANAWQQFIHVTCPGLRSTFVYVVVTVFIGACRVMTQPMLMTGYQSHTVTLSYYMYVQGYNYRWVGYSSAVALMMTIVIGTITYLQRRFLREKD